MMLAESFAKAAKRSSPRLREMAMKGPLREPLVAQIFVGMARAFDAERAGTLQAVVRWEIGELEAPRESTDRRQLVISDGRCRVTRKLEPAPNATIALDHLSLLELACGIANAPQLFITGRLRLQGDVALAQRLSTVFVVPGSRPRP